MFIYETHCNREQGGGHRGTTSRLPLQFFPASRLPVPFLPNLPPPTKSYNFAKNWPKMAEKWVKVIFQDHGVNENYLNMKFQAKLMQRSRENDQKPNFWKFAYKKNSDFSAEIGLRHFSTLITGRRHRMEPPIALVMGIPTSQTFFSFKSRIPHLFFTNIPPPRNHYVMASRIPPRKFS